MGEEEAKDIKKNVEELISLFDGLKKSTTSEENKILEDLVKSEIDRVKKELEKSFNEDVDWIIKCVKMSAILWNMREQKESLTSLEREALYHGAILLEAEARRVIGKLSEKDKE